MLEKIYELHNRIEELSLYLTLTRLLTLLDRIEYAKDDELDGAIQAMRDAIEGVMEEQCSS